MSGRWISTRDAQRIENKISQRHVTGWALIGSSFRFGRKMSGSVHLTLSGGGFIWYPESTPIDKALDDADDRGFDTKEVREKLDEWVKTGKGATFTLEGGAK